MRGEGGQKISVFVHAQGIKTVKKQQNSVHAVVECPLTMFIKISFPTCGAS